MTGHRTSQSVLILSNALSGGGAEVVARLMVANIDGASCALFENNADISVPGKEIRSAYQQHRTGVASKILVNFCRLIFIQWTKLRLRPLATISHLEGPNFFNVLTVFGGKKILFVHNMVSQSYPGSSLTEVLKRSLCRGLYKHADRVIGVSQGVCDELRDSLTIDPSKIYLLPNPVDVDVINKLSEAKYCDHRESLFDSNYILSVASLTPQKNHQFMLRIFRRLVEQGSEFRNLKLIILGDGPLRKMLVSFCQSQGLAVFDTTYQHTGDSFDPNAQVYFLGFEQNPYRLIKGAKLLLMTSKWEGLPIALLEAMALGVPAVVSDCADGVRYAWDITKDSDGFEKEGFSFRTDCGWLILNKDETDSTINVWTSAIESVLEEQSRAPTYNTACREKAARFDLNVVQRLWNDMLVDEARKKVGK